MAPVPSVIRTALLAEMEGYEHLLFEPMTQTDLDGLYALFYSALGAIIANASHFIDAIALGCELTFTFPTAKLIGWEDHWAELEANDNVFVLVVMAQVKAKRVKDGATRKDVKVALIRLMYERGYSREQVVQLFIIIDWMLQLPKAPGREFIQAVYAIQEEKHMPYVNTIERLGNDKGEKLGEVKGEARLLKKSIVSKYGQCPEWAQTKLNAADAEQLEAWAERIFNAETLEESLSV
ncbi:hypothetical protein QC823_15685 [Halomonas vilamensis]|uniref:DUF4351 domain-containing protein n=1 Tax=Vreelandella vilamensis TaxID=531309 RepID=A0ABU1H7Y3_9GAMM|nr:hypothetical protein [Halomonas vilamensis]MDR5900406.1 hypothetical protein [Halomonas vilamensis]